MRLHQICHSTIHALYSETELARRLNDVEALRADPRLVEFLGWIDGKPDDFHAPTRRSKTLSDRSARRSRD